MMGESLLPSRYLARIFADNYRQPALPYDDETLEQYLMRTDHHLYGLWAAHKEHTSGRA